MSNMIKTREDLALFCESDRQANLGDKKITAEVRYRGSFPYRVTTYLRLLRKTEYTCEKRDSAKNVLVSHIYSARIKMLDRKRNRLGELLGLEIPINRVERGVRIAHRGVILNGYVDEGCVFHGSNVLGNKKTGAREEIPRLGKNVDVGIGAMIIGGVEIADNCVIGAGAVVTKSFTVPGTVIAGVPAREIVK